LQYHRLPDFVKYLPYQNHKRALALLESGIVKFGNAWNSYYLPLAGQYWFFKLLNITDLIRTTILVNIFLSSISIFFLYKIALLLFNSKTAFITTIFAILYFPTTYLNLFILNENIFTPLLIISIYLLLTSHQKKSLKILFFAGITLGLTSSIRTILLPFLPLVLFWNLKNIKKSKKAIKSTTILSLGMLIPIIFTMILNYKFSHQRMFQLTSSTGINVFITQCKYKRVDYKNPTNQEEFWFSPPVFWKSSLPKITTSTPFYHQSFYLKKGLQCLWRKPDNLTKNLSSIKNIFHSLIYPNLHMTPFVKLMFTISKIFALLTAILFFLYPKITPSKTLKKTHYWLFFYLIISLFLSVYLANPGEERYLIPYTWIFFLFTPASLKALLEKKS